MAEAEIRRTLRFGRIGDALLFPFKNIATLIGLGLVPLLIGAAVIGAVFLAVRLPLDADAAVRDSGAALKMSVLAMTFLAMYMAITAIYATGIHRMIVRNERPGFVILRFRRYEMAFIGMIALTVLFYAVQSAALAPLRIAIETAYRSSDADARTLGVAVLGLLAIAATAWVNLRLSLVLPHAAVTGRIAFAPSWRATKGNVWRLLLGLAVTTFTILFAYAILQALASLAGALILLAMHLGAPKPYPILMALPIINLVLLTGVTGAAVFAYLSYAYKDLVEPLPEASAGQPAHAAA